VICVHFQNSREFSGKQDGSFLGIGKLARYYSFMQPQPDESAFDWIRRGRKNLENSDNAGWAGNFVSHLMPPVFEAYAKVLHGIEACYEHIDNPLSPNEISILNTPFVKSYDHLS
jgi:hypothetical protein